MVLESKRGPLNIYWSDIQDPNSAYTPGCYEKRFGMTCKRFQAISANLSLSAELCTTKAIDIVSVIKI